MLTTDYKEKFKKLCVDYNIIQEKLYNTFDLKDKNLLKLRIENTLKQIDKILDEYNKEKI